MHEKLPPISQEAIDGAWNDALRANSAYDGWQIATTPEAIAQASATAEGRLTITVTESSIEARIRITSFRIGSVALGAELASGDENDEEGSALITDELDGSPVDEESITELSAEEAELKFRQLSNAEPLGQMMLREDSPFNISSEDENIYSISDVEPTNSEVFNTLPYEYRNEAIGSFGLWTELISGAVDKGIVPENYLLNPDDERLQEQAIALYPEYEEMKENGLEPVIVFVPRHLVSGQWDNLLNGFLAVDAYENGETLNIDEDQSDSLMATMPDIEGILWDLAVVSGVDAQELTPVDAYSNTQEVMSLSANGTEIIEDGSTRKYMNDQLSPSLEMYYALQLTKIARGETPVNLADFVSNWTLLRESIEVDGATSMLIARFNAITNEVETALYNHDNKLDVVSIRPAISSSDILKQDDDLTIEFEEDKMIDLRY
jgi:hypothetical protein